MHKTLKVHAIHYSALEWVDRRKKRKIIQQELDDLDRMLQFIKADRTVDNKKWRSWKELDKVSTATWNVLLCQILASYFAKCLKNKGKLKHVYEF
jgi:hypothetical protein